MKIAVIILITCSLAGLVFITACHGMGKKGNGHVTIEERNISAFTNINIEGIFPVEISQDGGEASVKVETDENLQKLITVTNDGNTLDVRMPEHINLGKSTKMKVYINVKDLRLLDFKSVGSLVGKGNITVDSLEINSESVGKLDLELTANMLRANLSSVGSTTLRGTANEVRINNKSVGSLSAYELKAKTLMIHNTAVGTVEVYADSAIYIRSSAIGTLYYKGNAEVKELSSEGIGKVKKADD